MDMYSNKIIEAYKAISEFIIRGAKGQPPAWPFSISEINWYRTKFWAKEVFTILKKLERKGISLKEIAKLCYGPSSLSHWLYLPEIATIVPEVDPFEGLTKEEGVKFIEKTIDLISLQRKGDIYCRNGKNIIFSPEEVEKTLNTVDLKTPSQVEKNTLGKLNAVLWQYTILIQAGDRHCSQEFHGPYQIGRGTLFVRDYFNLKPICWDFCKQFPYQKLTIFEVYTDVEIKIDMFNHFQTSAPLPQKLIKFALLIDDVTEPKIISLQELFEISNKVLNEGILSVNHFTKDDWIKRMFELKFLWLKPLKELIGEKSEVPSNLYKLLDRKEEAERVATQFVERVTSMSMEEVSEEDAINWLTQRFLKVIYKR
jgi:hypothetical protein